MGKTTQFLQLPKAMKFHKGLKGRTFISVLPVAEVGVTETLLKVFKGSVEKPAPILFYPDVGRLKGWDFGEIQ